ncbi:MAG: cupin domain-containing protein [Elusimicrobia bacterium]|nr:cupin domain-containing protein [Elusimicrobiota bacterium]
MKNKPLKAAKLPPTEAKAFQGLRIFPLTPQGTGPFSALLITVEPNAHLPEIYHAKTFEFFYVLKGAASGHIDGKPIRFRKGEYAFMPPGMTHDLRAGRTRLEALAIFSPGLDLKKPDVVNV